MIMISWAPLILKNDNSYRLRYVTLDHTTQFHRLEHTFGLSGSVNTRIHSYCLTNRSSLIRFIYHLLLLTLHSLASHKVWLFALSFLFFSFRQWWMLLGFFLALTVKVKFYLFTNTVTALVVGIDANYSTLPVQIDSIESCTQSFWTMVFTSNHVSCMRPLFSLTPGRNSALVALTESVPFITVAGSPLKLQSSSLY